MGTSLGNNLSFGTPTSLDYIVVFGWFTARSGRVLFSSNGLEKVPK